MREPGEIAAAFPRPGRTLKAVLAVLAIFAIIGAVVVHWAPGGPLGVEIYSLLAFDPQELLRGGRSPRFWTLLTSGLLTEPMGISHALWSLVGLYFLTNDLERRWGGKRLLRFLATGVLFGNLAVLAGSLLPIDKTVFRPPFVVGPLAAIVATAIAWSKDNADRQIRFMFFLPMSGRTLFWLTVGMSVLALLFLQGSPEGAFAPLGGVIAGILFAGSPSPARSLWLRLRLGTMRRRGGRITVEQLLQDPDAATRPPRPKRGGKSPPLRILQGGLDEDLKNRKPPNDKRYLN